MPELDNMPLRSHNFEPHRERRPGCVSENDRACGYPERCGDTAQGLPGWYCTRPRDHDGDHVAITNWNGAENFYFRSDGSIISGCKPCHRVAARWAPGAGVGRERGP